MPEIVNMPLPVINVPMEIPVNAATSQAQMTGDSPSEAFSSVLSRIQNGDTAMTGEAQPTEATPRLGKLSPKNDPGTQLENLPVMIIPQENQPVANTELIETDLNKVLFENTLIPGTITTDDSTGNPIRLVDMVNSTDIPVNTASPSTSDQSDSKTSINKDSHVFENQKIAQASIPQSQPSFSHDLSTGSVQSNSVRFDLASVIPSLPNVSAAVYTPAPFITQQAVNPGIQPAITNPIASRENADAPQQNIMPTISPDSKTTVPFSINSPPDRPDPPPDNPVDRIETAGPRGKDTEPLADRSNRSTEEADTQGTRREVHSQTTHRIDWMNDYFRRPVNEVSRGKENLPQVSDVEVPLDQQVASQSSQTFRIPVNSINNPEVQRSLSPSQPSGEPQTAQAVKESDKSVVSNEVRLEQSPTPFVPAEKPENPVSIKEQKVDAYQPSTDSKPVSAEKSVQPDTQFNQANQQQTDSGKSFNIEQEKNFDSLGLKVVQQSVSDPQGSLSVNQPQSSIASGNPPVVNNVIPQVTQINTRMETKIIDNPMPILDDAPNRIASEIMQSDIDNLQEGQSSILKVELKPPRLGHMNIEIAKSDSGVDVKLVVRTMLAKEILFQKADEIKASLQQHGIEVRKFEIIDLNQNRQDSQNQPQGFSSGQMPYSRGGQESYQRNAEFTSEGTVDIESELDESRALGIQTNRNTGGHLNILA